MSSEPCSSPPRPGLRRALHGSADGTWVPRLVRIVGVGMACVSSVAARYRGGL
ncbi:hypothetical protein [Streptomyces flavofungini]|uniref:hypothetical protein n=1 Tax=Streptomyces flavofungini TaxID=68200 RepID=UPI0025B24B5A|nr:hypothetical protein [Streptomyces flavofungini]WJV51640.1 hypothetical protein QUY26_35790 [Streptomyces flavofungini]